MLAKLYLMLLLLLLALFVQDGEAWRRRRRRRAPPPCHARNCQVSGWSGWSACSHRCGNAGTQYRTRSKTVTEACGGRCPYHFRDQRNCNRNACQNGGTPLSGRCSCRSGFTGTCCEQDVNECARNPSPCQHICINTHGSYTCQCHSCYTKLGTRCDLRQCKISNRCYAYGTKNPSNACQDCNSANKGAWTNNNALPCSDGNLCTRADSCVNGQCVGTPFTCLPCEQCNGNTCTVKPVFCSITVNGTKTCFSHNDLRPEFPCQQCKSNNPHQWTNNNNLPCSDNSVKTKDDRCVNGVCHGTPYSCLPCETHDGRGGCPLKNGHGVMKLNGARICFTNRQPKPFTNCYVYCPVGSINKSTP